MPYCKIRKGSSSRTLVALMLMGVAFVSVANDLRWVSLSPAISETIFKLNAGEVLVGRSDYCTRPDSIVHLPKAGTALTPNYEAIVNLSPDLIVTEASVHAPRDLLRKIGRTLELPWLSRDDIAGSVMRLGELLERPFEASILSARFLNELTDEVPAAGPEVLLVLGGGQIRSGQIWYIKRNSIHGAALHAAGGRNAVNRDVGGASVLSLEGLLAVNPDLIIVFDPSGRLTREQAMSDYRELSMLSAVKRSAIFVIAGEQYLSPGPAVLELPGKIRSILKSIEW